MVIPIAGLAPRLAMHPAARRKGEGIFFIFFAVTV
jgi:hypothetical protein